VNLYALDARDGLRDEYRRGLRFGPPEVRWLQSHGALPASVIRPNHHRGCASYLLPEQWRDAFSAKLELVDDFPPFCKHEASKELVLSSLLEAREVATESHRPGVYFLFDEGTLVYSGTSHGYLDTDVVNGTRYYWKPPVLPKWAVPVYSTDSDHQEIIDLAAKVYDWGPLQAAEWIQARYGVTFDYLEQFCADDAIAFLTARVDDQKPVEDDQ